MRSISNRPQPVATSNNIVKASELEELSSYNAVMNEKLRQRDQMLKIAEENNIMAAVQLSNEEAQGQVYKGEIDSAVLVRNDAPRTEAVSGSATIQTSAPFSHPSAVS